MFHFTLLSVNTVFYNRPISPESLQIRLFQVQPILVAELLQADMRFLLPDQNHRKRNCVLQQCHAVSSSSDDCYKEIDTSTGSVCLFASLFGGFFGILISDNTINDKSEQMQEIALQKN